MDVRDKRRDPRIDTTQRVWVEGQDLRCEGEAQNMSSRGMFVVAKATIPEVGSTLDVTFEDPHEGSIALKMEVVWRDEAPVDAKVGLRVAGTSGSVAFERVVARYLREREDEREGEEQPAPSESPSSATSD